MPSLAETHRLAQLRVGTLTVAALRPLWRLLDPNALDSTFPAWLAAVAPVVQAQRLQSSRLAAAYLDAERTSQINGTYPAIFAGDAPMHALSTSLLVTGPISVKKAMTRGVPLANALDVAEAASSAVAMRHALDGGRETILTTIKADPRARGWERIASGGACPFCSERSGEQMSSEEVFQAHPGCACSAAPIYR